MQGLGGSVDTLDKAVSRKLTQGLSQYLLGNALQFSHQLAIPQGA